MRSLSIYWLHISRCQCVGSLSEILTGSKTFSAEPVPLSTAPFHELNDRFHAAVREATEEDLKDAAARWAELPPWKALDPNPMDLAGFLLHLQSLVQGPGREANAIFIFMARQ